MSALLAYLLTQWSLIERSINNSVFKVTYTMLQIDKFFDLKQRSTKLRPRCCGRLTTGYDEADVERIGLYLRGASGLPCERLLPSVLRHPFSNCRIDKCRFIAFVRQPHGVQSSLSHCYANALQT